MGQSRVVTGFLLQTPRAVGSRAYMTMCYRGLGAGRLFRTIHERVEWKLETLTHELTNRGSESEVLK